MVTDLSEIPDLPQAPEPRRVHEYLLYSLSLPERALRSTVGLAGGVLRESADLLVPQAFRSSKSYSILIQQGLDFLTDDVAGVRRKRSPDEAPKIENYVAKKAVGNFVEMASLATLHVSPMLLLAIVGDVAYGSKAYLKELAEELKKEGVIDQDSTIDKASDLLDAIGESSSASASIFDTPPLSIEGMREAIESTTKSVSRIDPTTVLPASEVDRLWRDMQSIAAEENVSLLEVSGAVTLHALDRVAKVGQGALSTVTCATNLFDRHVVHHYRTALGDIHSEGYYATLSRVSGLYIAAVWDNFSTERTTITEDLLNGKIVGQAARTVGRWFGLGAVAPELPAEANSPEALETPRDPSDDSPTSHAEPQ